MFNRVDVISKHGEVESGEEHLQNLAVHQNVDHELMDHLEVKGKTRRCCGVTTGEKVLEG